MIPMLAQIAISALLVFGGIFGLVGSWALVKLPDPMTRLHGPTKTATLGVGSVLIASMIHTPYVTGHLTLHELLITVFVTLTAPVTGLFIAKANMHLGWPKDSIPPPDGPPGVDWATYGDPEDPPEIGEVLRAD